MEGPVQINFQGRKRKQSCVGLDRHIALLEQRFGRATAVRISLRGSCGRHRTAVCTKPISVSRCRGAGARSILGARRRLTNVTPI